MKNFNDTEQFTTHQIVTFRVKKIAIEIFAILSFLIIYELHSIIVRYMY